MDYIRYPYTGYMRFYKDSDVLTPVCWYFAAEEAKTLPYYTRFASGLHSKDKMDQWQGVGEAAFTRLDFGSLAVCCEGDGTAPIGTEEQFAQGVNIADVVVPQKLIDECGPCLTYDMPDLVVGVNEDVEGSCWCCCSSQPTLDSVLSGTVQISGFPDGAFRSSIFNGTWIWWNAIDFLPCHYDARLPDGYPLVGQINHDETTNRWGFFVEMGTPDGWGASYSGFVDDFNCDCQTVTLTLDGSGPRDGPTPPATILWHTCGSLDLDATPKLLTQDGRVIKTESGDNLL